MRALLLLSLAAACGGTPAGDTATLPGDGDDAETLARVLALGPVGDPPPDPTNAVADDPAAAHFGQYLFFDPRLSGTGTFACSTCHDPQQGFSDGLRLSEAAGTTSRHAQSLWNVAHNRWAFWDGRCDTLWCQAAQPIEAGHEMASSRLQVVHALAGADDLRQGYEAVFGPLPDLSDTSRFPAEGRPVADEPEHPHQVAWDTMRPEDQAVVTGIFVDVLKAIAAYERTLLTGETAVDRYVAAVAADDPAAMEAALDPAARAGLDLFVGEGNCHFCHAGALMSNGEFNGIGLGPRGWLDPEDLGRYQGIEALRADPFNAAGPWSDAPEGEAAARIDRLALTSEQVGQFKVPSLRQVAASPPYMHGGHFDTLDEVVHYYAQLDEEPVVGHVETLLQPRDWGAEEEAALVAFLNASSAEPRDPGVVLAPDSPVLRR